MPRVYSRRKGADPIPEGAVYVGRGTPYGNPFKAKAHTYEEHARVVAMFREWIMHDDREWLRMQAARELHGRDLVCWCQCPSDENPLPCHATVLLEVANGCPPVSREGEGEPHWTDACEPEQEDGVDPDRQRDEAYARRNGHT